MVYLKIIRPINLGMLLLLQVIIKFGFFEPLALPLAMNVFQFCLLLLATLTIAAAGNVINDIYDTTIDAVNKPNRVIVGNYISEKNAYTFYIILTSLGVCAGFLLANQLGKPGLAAVFIIIAAILYMYASYLSALLLIGNIIVSALVAFALITVILFDIYPMLNANIAGYQIPLRIVLVYAAFAFYFNLLREIVKDIEDVNGDKKGERNTLAIALGRERTRNITFILGVFALVAILWITYSYVYQHMYLAFYIVFCICGPLLYFCIKSWDAKDEKAYGQMSIALKITMITGIFSLAGVTEMVQNIITPQNL